MAAAGSTNGDNRILNAGRGEKLLSNKSRQKLAKENDQLQKEARMLQKQCDKLRKRIVGESKEDKDNDDRDEEVIESNFSSESV